ncbi:phosphotransferase [Labrys sp. La1]|uniref:phosphotransferase n=1 Tax=Labrys sp. La1 TaxID=3404917 RepID=UPI003EB9337A
MQKRVPVLAKATRCRSRKRGVSVIARNATFDCTMPAMHHYQDRLAALPLWGGPVAIEAMTGGLTNRNLLITAKTGRFVARIADDNAAHDIDRAAEQAATRAASECGLGPELVWAEPGLMILRYIDGKTLRSADLAGAAKLRRSLALLGRVRREMPARYDGTRRDRSPIALLTGYAKRLATEPNRWQQAIDRYRPLIERLRARLELLPSGFAHNDVHGDNIIDDGERLWLLDWEYAGYGQPLVDLASLVNNAGLRDEAIEIGLADWLGHAPTHSEGEDFATTRLAAAMRDLFWGYAQDGLVADQPGKLDDYISINEGRVNAAAALI